MRTLVNLFFLLIFINNSHANYDGGNIMITSEAVSKTINQFIDQCIATESLSVEQPGHVVIVSFYEQKNSITSIQIELFDTGIGRAYLHNNFYGFALHKKLHIIFWNKNKYIEKVNNTNNPALFSKDIIKKALRNVYHPYNWWIVIHNDEVLKSDGEVRKSNNNEDSILRKIKTLNFTRYHDKPVISFLQKIGGYKKFIPATEPPRIVQYVIFTITGNISVYIAVKNLGKLADIRAGKLDIDKFCEKKIDILCLKYKGDCIKGCAGNSLMHCD